MSVSLRNLLLPGSGPNHSHSHAADLVERNSWVNVNYYHVRTPIYYKLVFFSPHLAFKELFKIVADFCWEIALPGSLVFLAWSVNGGPNRLLVIWQSFQTGKMPSLSKRETGLIPPHYNKCLPPEQRACMHNTHYQIFRFPELSGFLPYNATQCGLQSGNQ